MPETNCAHIVTTKKFKDEVRSIGQSQLLAVRLPVHSLPIDKHVTTGSYMQDTCASIQLVYRVF